MPRIRHPQWRDELESTRYPFAAAATLQNAQGDFFLEGSFLDAHLYPIGGEAPLYLSRVTVAHDLITLVIGDGTTAELASGSFSTASPPENVPLFDSYRRAAGVFVSDAVRLGFLRSWGLGDHFFEPAQTEFCAMVCTPTPEIGVRGVLLADGSVLTGHVYLLGEDGVVLRREQARLPGRGCEAGSGVYDVIRVDVVGDPLFRRRLCEPNNLFAAPRPVRKLRAVNGSRAIECGPDEHGRMTIQMNDQLAGQPALRLRQTRDGLAIEVVGATVREV